MPFHLQSGGLVPLGQGDCRLPGAPGSGRLALHLPQSPGRPSSVLSVLLESARSEEPASAEVSPLLPASSETMLGTQVGARRLRAGLFRT